MEKKERKNKYCREKLSFLSFHARAKETRVLPGGVCRGSGEAHFVSDIGKYFSCRGRVNKNRNKHELHRTACEY